MRYSLAATGLKGQCMQNAGHLKEKYWNMVNIDENTRRKTPNGVPAVLAILSRRFGGRFSASQAIDRKSVV